MQQAEQGFETSLATAQDKSAHARTTFDSLDKPKLRAVLLAEQRSVCVYCERRVEETEPPPPIEHWRPLANEPEHALNWENLYLSCPADGSCDDRKKGQRLAWTDNDQSLPWPTQVDYEKWVGFTSTGRMYVRSDAPLTTDQRRALELALDDRDDNGTRRLAILNLNHAALVAARKAAIDSEKDRLKKEFEGKTASKADRSSIATRLLAQAKRPQFVSIRVAYLEKSLGRGRP